jgi:hypothetical protein
MTTLGDRWGDRWRAATTRPTAVTVAPSDARAREEAAYAKGRRDEKRLHPSHPIISVALVLVGAVGALALYYAVREGSFAGAGAVLDHKVAVAETSAIPAIQNAAETAAPKVKRAAETAGAAIRSDATTATARAQALASTASGPAKP